PLHAALPIWPVVRGGHEGHHMHGELTHGHGRNGPDHRRSAGHVAFHGIHAVGGGLQAEATRVVHHAFAHQYHGFFVHGTFGFPFHHDEHRRIDAALVHGQQSAHALG